VLYDIHQQTEGFLFFAGNPIPIALLFEQLALYYIKKIHPKFSGSGFYVQRSGLMNPNRHNPKELRLHSGGK